MPDKKRPSRSPWNTFLERRKAQVETDRKAAGSKEKTSISARLNPFRPLDWDKPPQSDSPIDLELGKIQSATTTMSSPVAHNAEPREVDCPEPDQTPARLGLQPPAGMPSRPSSGGRSVQGDAAWKNGDDASDDIEPERWWRLKKVTPKTPFTVANQIQRTFLRAPINALLLMVPIGFVFANLHSQSVATFVVNWLAALPLYGLAEGAMEEISLRIDEVIAGFLYLTTW